MNRIIFSVIQLTFILTNAFGQTEYLVTIDPVTGGFSKIDSIPDIKWLWPAEKTFDIANRRFTFRGFDAKLNSYLYTIDAKTGITIASPPFPDLQDKNDNIISYQYSSKNNKLYALHWDDSQKKEYLVSINIFTGAITLIDSLPGIIEINFPSAYDRVNDRYIFAGGDKNHHWCLYSVDVNTGQIISKPSFPSFPDPQDNIADWRYSNLSQKMYALHWDNTKGTEYLVSIEVSTGLYTIIDSLPVAEISTGIYTTFDEKNNRYIFLGADRMKTWRLYSIDANTGQVISNPKFPAVKDPKDNIVSLEADSLGVIYGLHWDNEDFSVNGQSDFAQIYPNPFTEKCIIILKEEFNEVETIVYNSIGQVVIRQSNFNSKKINILRDNLACGEYNISVLGNKILLGTIKMVVE